MTTPLYFGAGSERWMCFKSCFLVLEIVELFCSAVFKKCGAQPPAHEPNQSYVAKSPSTWDPGPEIWWAVVGDRGHDSINCCGFRGMGPVCRCIWCMGLLCSQVSTLGHTLRSTPHADPMLNPAWRPMVCHSSSLCTWRLSTAIFKKKQKTKNPPKNKTCKQMQMSWYYEL